MLTAAVFVADQGQLTRTVELHNVHTLWDTIFEHGSHDPLFTLGCQILPHRGLESQMII